jgi:hypothetical protein
MIRITSKVKIAAGIAAGALALGAAGAYAANANNTITVDPTKTFTLGTAPSPTLNLVPVNSSAASLTLPSGGFKDPGQCVSWLASNRNYALAPTGTSTKVSKNYHGKLMSQANAFCKSYVTSTTKTSSTESETDSSDTAQSGALQSQGHGHGQGRLANETD